MDTLTFFDAPSFNPKLLDAPEGYYTYTRLNPNPYRAFNELEYWTTTRTAQHNYPRRSDTSGVYKDNENTNAFTTSSNANTATGGTASTVSYAPGMFLHPDGHAGHTSNASYDNVSTSLSFDTANSHGYSSHDNNTGASENVTVQDQIGAYYSGTTGGSVTNGTVREGEIGIFNAGTGTVTISSGGVISMEKGQTTGIKINGGGIVTGATGSGTTTSVVSLAGNNASGGVGVEAHKW